MNKEQRHKLFGHFADQGINLVDDDFNQIENILFPSTPEARLPQSKEEWDKFLLEFYDNLSGLCWNELIIEGVKIGHSIPPSPKQVTDEEINEIVKDEDTGVNGMLTYAESEVWVSGAIWGMRKMRDLLTK